MFTLPFAPDSALRPENQKMPEMWLHHQNRFQKNPGLVQKPRHKRSGTYLAEVQAAAETGKTLQKNVKQKRRKVTDVDLKGRLAGLRRWLAVFPLVKITSVRENRITALFTSLPKKHTRKDKKSKMAERVQGSAHIR